jgi:hypothetical protein
MEINKSQFQVQLGRYPFMMPQSRISEDARDNYRDIFAQHPHHATNGRVATSVAGDIWDIGTPKAAAFVENNIRS